MTKNSKVANIALEFGGTSCRNLENRTQMMQRLAVALQHLFFAAVPPQTRPNNGSSFENMRATVN